MTELSQYEECGKMTEGVDGQSWCNQGYSNCPYLNTQRSAFASNILGIAHDDPGASEMYHGCRKLTIERSVA